MFKRHGLVRSAIRTFVYAAAQGTGYGLGAILILNVSSKYKIVRKTAAFDAQPWEQE